MVSNISEEVKNEIREQIKNANPKVDEYFRIPKHYVKMIAQSKATSLILLSEGGLGKSHLVLRTLIEQELDFAYFNSYSTPMQLYNLLYDNKDELIIFDDLEGLLSNETAISILKGALWSTTKKREIHYLSSAKQLGDRKKSFVFSGRIIFLLNQFPDKSRIVKSLITRTLYYELNFPYKMRIEIMRQIAEQPYNDLTKEERLKIVDFVEKNSDETTNELNLRTLIKAYQIYSYSKEVWEELVKGLLISNAELVILKRILINPKCTKVKKQIVEFVELTGRHRATFFNWKKKLLNRGLELPKKVEKSTR